ncbi:hypothetical protein GJAV_G00151210 [Gymnothorax javanicus]|nr:hypothetical protein GJAV_G00151210 [Gymnothorax javanicus]
MYFVLYGGSDNPAQPRPLHVDSRLSHTGPGGSSSDSDCAFEGDYAVPPPPVTEGMQHIRMMEGVSRSLPSSPLLTHQTISLRLQPMKKLTGRSDSQWRCLLLLGWSWDEIRLSLGTLIRSDSLSLSLSLAYRGPCYLLL